MTSDKENIITSDKENMTSDKENTIYCDKENTKNIITSDKENIIPNPVLPLQLLNEVNPFNHNKGDITPSGPHSAGITIEGEFTNYYVTDISQTSMNTSNEVSGPATESLHCSNANL
ncbi:hypothetical protein PoB_002230000 [Plakobranchus ocellatus]|uniref:Uncharacterized protein n=1 Tax=Plakobranchus ocellatus TaxID=259542 RepID=A0AAV3ZJH0_9GAST|nr:hypothetical protein PoB_002230000 [Plakobranchus ocellatus]